MKTDSDISTNRAYKDSLFRHLFGDDKKQALSLYNALNHTNYTNENDIEITTLEDVIYIKQKNDVSILVGSTLNLYELQSTYNPNMPLRGLLYYADLYRQLIKKGEDLYRNRLYKIPLPRYVVFYNGNDKKLQSEIIKLRLSDAFEIPDYEHEFEWTATVVDITEGRNTELKNSCECLREYCVFVETVRKYLNAGHSRNEAIDLAVDECIKNGILAEYLNKHRREVKNVTLTEFDEEYYKQVMREDAFEDGKLEGTLLAFWGLYKDGTITLLDAATRSGLSESEFVQKCEELSI